MWVDFFIGSPLYSAGFLSDFLVLIPSQLKFTRDNLNLNTALKQWTRRASTGMSTALSIFFLIYVKISISSRKLCVIASALLHSMIG